MQIPLSRKLDIASRLLFSSGKTRFASLFITRKCNLACPYCRSISQTTPDLSLSQWKTAIDKLHSFGVRLFNLTGGEPLVREDTFDIIKHITHTKRSVCWMISNFKAMSPEIVDKLVEAGLQFLTCSFDTLSSRGVKADKSVLDLLVYAKKAGIIPSTLTVVTKNNIGEIPEIVRQVTSRGIIFDMGLYQHVGGLFSPDDTTYKPSLSSVENMRRYLLSQKKTGLIAPSSHYLKESIEYYRESSWKCSADKNSFVVVNNDGSLMPCQEYGSPVSIFDIDSMLDDRWTAEKNVIIEGCSGCFYGCYYQKTHIAPGDVLYDAWMMLKI